MTIPFWKLCLYAILAGSLAGYTIAVPERASEHWVRGLAIGSVFAVYAAGQWLWQRIKG